MVYVLVIIGFILGYFVRAIVELRRAAMQAQKEADILMDKMMDELKGCPDCMLGGDGDYSRPNEYDSEKMHLHEPVSLDDRAWIDNLVKEPKRKAGRPLGLKNRVKK